jgi:hypothetical protein
MICICPDCIENLQRVKDALERSNNDLALENLKLIDDRKRLRNEVAILSRVLVEQSLRLNGMRRVVLAARAWGRLDFKSGRELTIQLLDTVREYEKDLADASQT